MKTSFFHLMPYQHLPADFEHQYRSAWVDPPNSLFDPELCQEHYDDYIAELQFADQVGFDGVCVNEHHNNGYGLMPSPNLVGSALARATTDAAILILGNSLALYNPPLRVAEEMAMIDCISGGRMIGGFPIGTPMDTCFAYGQNPSTLRQRYLEAHDVIMRAWREEDVFSFNGRFNQLRYVNIWPRPVQKPHPPVWIPGGGANETLRWCVDNDYVFCALSYFGYDAAQGVLGAYKREIDAGGKEQNPFRSGYLQFVGVAETHAEAERIYREPAEYFYARCLHLYPGFTDAPGYRTESTIRRQIAAARPGGGVAALGTMGAPKLEDIVERGYLVLGEPDEVADRLREIAKDLNVGNLMTLLQFGNMDRDTANYNTHLFAQRVMPQIADLFEDEWEHHWWPNPMPRQERTLPQAVAV